MRLEIPLFLPSVANLREHWAPKAKRVKRQRQVVALFLRPALQLERPALPVVVTLIRSGPRLLDQEDNLPAAFKAVRDQVASELGITDGPKDKRARWLYDQQVGPKGFLIVIEAAKTEAA